MNNGVHSDDSDDGHENRYHNPIRQPNPIILTERRIRDQYFDMERYLPLPEDQPLPNQHANLGDEDRRILYDQRMR